MSANEKMIDSRYSIEYISEETHKGKQFIKMSISTLVLAGLAITTSSLLLYKTLTAEAASTKPYTVNTEKKNLPSFEPESVEEVAVVNAISETKLQKKQALITSLIQEKEDIKKQLEAETKKHSLQINASVQQNAINKELLKELADLKKLLAAEKENSAELSREVEIKVIENQTLTLLLNDSLGEKETQPTTQQQAIPSTMEEVTTTAMDLHKETVKPTPIVYKAEIVQDKQEITQEASGLSQVDAIIEAIKNAKK